MERKEIIIEDNRQTFVNTFFNKDYIHQYILSEVFHWGTHVISENFTIAKSTNSNSKIWHKLIHIIHTTNAGLEIMQKEKTIDWNYQTGITLCFLHDIGRFPQAQTNSFDDSVSKIDHAKIGADMIKAQNFNIKNIDLIIDAVYWHSRKINKSNTNYSKLIRDADKVAIFEHFQNMEDSENPPIANSLFVNKIRHQYLDTFLNSNETLDNKFETNAERLLCMYTWFRDLNFESTKQICQEKNYPDMILRYMNNLKLDNQQMKLIKNKTMRALWL
jgi:hypothetical protein